MTIGVTGSKGFIGSYLTRRLAAGQRGCLRLLVRNAGSDYVPPDGVELVHGDLGVLTDCDQFAAGANLIYYLAHANTPVNSDLDQAVGADRIPETSSAVPEQHAAQCKPSHEGRKHGGDRIRRVPEYEAEHPEPDDLVEEGGCAREKETDKKESQDSEELVSARR